MKRTIVTAAVLVIASLAAPTAASARATLPHRHAQKAVTCTRTRFETPTGTYSAWGPYVCDGPGTPTKYVSVTIQE